MYIQGSSRIDLLETNQTANGDAVRFKTTGFEKTLQLPLYKGYD